MPTRDELRQKLRDKIRNGRDAHNVAGLQQQVKRDPATFMLSMGVDNATMLQEAKNIVANPRETLQKLTKKTADEQKHAVEVEVEVEVEEAPPNANWLD